MGMAVEVWSRTGQDDVDGTGGRLRRLDDALKRDVRRAGHHHWTPSHHAILSDYIFFADVILLS